MFSQETMEFFEALSDCARSTFFYICDMQTGLSRWSGKAVKYFDLPDEYMNDVLHLWVDKIHPDDRQIYLDDVTAVFEGKKRFHDCRYRAKNRYGEYVWLNCKGSAVYKDGKPYMFGGYIHRIDLQNPYDELTGLKTAGNFYNSNFRVGEGGIMLLGIDGFSVINNYYGYQVGDNLLRNFAEVLQKLTPDNAEIIRFQGDQFMVIQPNFNEQAMQALFARFNAGLKELSAAASIGLTGAAVMYPKHAQDVESIYDCLEKTYRHAKTEHRSKLVFFSDHIATITRRYHALREELTKSVKVGFKGFELYYQPIVCPKTERVLGCEALLRWYGRDIKDANPIEFIKVLEENGDIVPVGEWVFVEAAKQLVEWKAKYGKLFVNVNVSYRQLVEDEFLERMIASVHEHQLCPDDLTIELTESNSVKSTAVLAEIFHRLQKEGVSVALDDFGTAYSSMELLKDLPVNYVKFEHTMVKDLMKPGHDVDLLILKNMLRLFEELHQGVVIEGVESRELADELRNLGPSYFQGYLYGKPMPAVEFEKLLIKERC